MYSRSVAIIVGSSNRPKRGNSSEQKLMIEVVKCFYDVCMVHQKFKSPLNKGKIFFGSLFVEVMIKLILGFGKNYRASNSILSFLFC